MPSLLLLLLLFFFACLYILANRCWCFITNGSSPKPVQCQERKFIDSLTLSAWPLKNLIQIQGVSLSTQRLSKNYRLPFILTAWTDKGNMQTFQACFIQPRKNRKIMITCKVTTFQSTIDENTLRYRCVHGKNSI